jgi:hypothetical protein
MQAKQANELAAKLVSFQLNGFLQENEFPAWVANELARAGRTDSKPDDALPERADDRTIRRWMTEFVIGAGVGERFRLATGIDHFPWMDITVRDGGWLDNLVDVMGYGPTLVSHAKDVLVVFYEEEYEYQAFRCSPP